ncbi:hypothetical protein [Hymenobacter negativus]|uniref:Uncharacterized protein n=1 Tax=Hymenobacter negativus TaxID=2795026 RepID=A0ABS3QF68_9BACT|nr:hypothetical protein [Hymenobacter negativus]MBO2009900.1 hypothetical protein [Hymenobacter negativus]
MSLWFVHTPYHTSVAFADELPTIGSVILKLFEVTELIFSCKNIAVEGELWHLIDPITSMEIELMVYEQSYALFSYPFDLDGQHPNWNSDLLQSTLFALTELGSQPENTLEEWAGEPWCVAKSRWNPKHIDGRGRN